MPPTPQPRPTPFRPAVPPSPHVPRKNVLRNQKEPVKGNPIDHGTNPVLLGTWTAGNGFGWDGTLYLTFPTTAAGVVLSASGNEDLKNPRSNNQPQNINIFMLDGNWNSVATLFSMAANGEWITLADAIINPMIEISGSSIMDHGYNFPDSGVNATLQYFSSGVTLYLNFDDCGSEGNNPDHDFKDKQLMLWIPIVYQKDFNTVSVFVEGNGNGNLIKFE